MPMEQTPGFLSRAINQQLKRGCRASGSIKDVDMCFATKYREWQRSDEAVQKEVHKCFQLETSTPKRPTEPLVRRAIQ